MIYGRGSRFVFGAIATVRSFSKISRKKFTKGIDGVRDGYLASRAATSEGGRETETSIAVNHPIGFFVPSKEGSLRAWPGEKRQGSECESAWK